MAAENHFDISCKVDMQEVSNAIDQSQREIETRYDLKGGKNTIEQDKMVLTVQSPDDMKLKAVVDILQSKLHSRGIDLRALTSAIRSRRPAARSGRPSPCRTAFPSRRPVRSSA